MDYQAATDEVMLKERRAWQVLLDPVVLREKREQVAKMLNTGTGSSVPGSRTTDVTLVW